MKKGFKYFCLCLIGSFLASTMSVVFAQGDLENQFYGILTYRGNAYRDMPQYQPQVKRAEKIKTAWVFKTTGFSKTWGTGSGWTGQPLIVHWTKEQKQLMKLDKIFVEDPNFTEVIFGSLDGKVYFVNLANGKETRTAIDVGNPIKGTLSIHSTGLPILYVGNGIPDKKPFGLRLYSLIDKKEIYFTTDHPKAWNAFDSSALFIPEEDKLVVGGENGYFYEIKLNSELKDGKLSIRPLERKIRLLAGVESSVSRAQIADRYYYFCSDNKGNFYKIDEKAFKVTWRLALGDDTDATPVLANEKLGKEKILMAYVGTEVDRQGKFGKSRFYKLDLQHEKIIWQKAFSASSAGEGIGKSDGGIIAPAVLGMGETENQVYFGVNRWRSKEGGSVVSLDRKTGKTLWVKDLNTRFWSGMTSVVDEKNNQRLIATDRGGQVYLMDAKSSKTLDVEKRNSYTESSLSGIGRYFLSTTRTGQLYCYYLE